MDRARRSPQRVNIGSRAEASEVDDLARPVETADDLADLRAAQAARDELSGSGTALPWEQVKADLGLV
ncbi:type II toxin-antitoxin system Phd/YefM family antitoxin [Cellulosimicrobium cellulans]|nr:type II toxin-antitoxin system Phd/YefM family antitoxin [Cellulosimicrobium cellulans]